MTSYRSTQAEGIRPVEGGGERPLWSVMTPTFNCAELLRQTLASVLAQDPGPALMQIEVIDDHSTKDDPGSVVRDLAPGRVQFYQKPINEGAIANFNTCIARSRGQLIHILHGDDWVEPSFYEAVAKAFELHPEVEIVFTRAFNVDEAGNLDSLSARIASFESPDNDASPLFYENPIRTPGVVVRRKLYERIGGFEPTLIHAADWEMWIRCISSSKALFINRPLVSYRYFAGNDTGRLQRSAENLRDCLRMRDLVAAKLVGFDQTRFNRQQLSYAERQITTFLELGDVQSVRANQRFFEDLLESLPLRERVFQRSRRAKAAWRQFITRLVRGRPINV